MLTVDYNRLGLKPGERLLDLGCGFGRHAYEAARQGAHVVACDLASAELAEVRATFAAMSDAGEQYHGTCQAAQGDATRLPFPDQSFDRVIASEVLEHVDSDDQALAELTRILRPGGVLAVTVPTWFPEKVCWALSDEYHAPKAVGGHVRIYRRSELRRRTPAGRLGSLLRPPRPRAAQPLLVVAVRGRPQPRRPSAGGGLSPALGMGYCSPTKNHPNSRTGPESSAGQEPGSL